MQKLLRMTFACVAAASVALAGCAGSKGDPGAQGTPGDAGKTGPQGTPGPAGTVVTTGSVAGTATFTLGGTTFPASGVTVATTPNVAAAGATPITTGPDGSYTLALPVGSYTLTFSSPDYATFQQANVAVTASSAPVTVSPVLTKKNPLVVTVAAGQTAFPAGFNAPVDLTASASYVDQKTGALTAATATYSWSVVASPVATPTLSATTGATVTLTTDKVEAIMAAGKVPNFKSPSAGSITVSGASVPKPRPGFVPVTTNMLALMKYTLKVTATDAQGWSNSATFDVTPATLAQGTINVPVNTVVIAADAGAATWAWAFAAKPTASALTGLNGADTKYPWFIPDVAGTYTVQNGAGAALTVYAADGYAGAFSDGRDEATLAGTAGGPTSGACMDCHTGKYGAQADAWTTGGHGNFNWKDPTKPVESIFQAGISGDIEGGFYSASCVGCHTTGYNAGAKNGGFDDVMAADIAAKTFVFPKTFVPGNWDLVPADMKKLAGIQCESCHGPHAMGGWDEAGGFAGGFGKASAEQFVKPSYAAEMCGQCHDAPTHHDKYPMWAKSIDPESGMGHANTKVATLGAVDLRLPNLTITAYDPVAKVAANPATNWGAASCARCHTAQGFVAFVKQLQANPTACANGTSGVVPDSCFIQPAGFDPVLGALKADGVTRTGTPNLDLEKYLAGLGLVSVPNASVPAPTQPTVNGVKFNAPTEPNGAAIPTFTTTQLSAVEPQTCQACHDPHSTQVRVEGDSPVLIVGFSVKGAGAGAVCVMCHNNRNGARGDGITTFPLSVVNNVSVQAIGTAHDGPQADVYWGQNAFFVNGYNPSRHAAVKDTCAGCHVNLPGQSGSTTSSPNHTFLVDDTLCASCHSAGVTGEGTKGAFQSALADETSTFASVYLTQLNAALTANANGLVINGSKNKVVVQAGSVTKAVYPVPPSTPGGEPSYSSVQLTFASAITDPNNTTGTVTTFNVSLTNLFVNSGTVAAPTLGATAFSPTGLFARAMWNNSIVVNDGSQSIHNPTFVQTVVASTKAALLNKPATVASY